MGTKMAKGVTLKDVAADKFICLRCATEESRTNRSPCLERHHEDCFLQGFVSLRSRLVLCPMCCCCPSSLLASRNRCWPLDHQVWRCQETRNSTQYFRQIFHQPRPICPQGPRICRTY